MEDAKHCTRCGSTFTDADNNETACRHHPGELLDYNSGNEKRHRESRGGAGGDFWDCCNTQVDGDGTSVGCTTIQHTTDLKEYERGEDSHEDIFRGRGLVFNENGDLVLGQLPDK